MQPNETAVSPYKSGAFDEYVTFCALGGMIVSDTGDITFVSQAQFCERFDVDRVTLWRWKRDTPNMAELIRQRRNEIVPLARETAALNRLLVIGMSSLGTNRQHSDQRSAVDALKTYLGHHSELKLPTQPQKIEAGQSLMDLVNIARKKNVIEGEFSDRTDTIA